MPIRYRKVQNKIKNSTNYNLWYGKSVVLNQVKTDQLCEEIAHSTTVTESDVRAVLAELKAKLNDHLGNSESLKLDGIGTFSAAIRTSICEKKEDFTVAKIKGYRINFRPETYISGTSTDATGKTKKVKGYSMLKNPKVQEMTEYKAQATTTTGS